MRCVGVISAMWSEVELLYLKMEKVNEIYYAGSKYYVGKMGNVKIVLSVCGIGKVNAAIYTQIMIDKFEIDYLIHTGIAGSMDDSIKHSSVVIADGLTYYDVRSEQLRNCYPYQEVFIPDERMIDLLIQSNETDVRKGLIITGDEFISNKDRKLDLKRRFPNALCVEMEGCAVANVAFVNNIPFVVIRCISDLADDSASLDYESFEIIAAKKATEMVINILSLL